MSDEVPSPCVSVCSLNTTGEHCLGCFRTLNEIAEWSRYDDEKKRAVLALVDARRRDILSADDK